MSLIEETPARQVRRANLAIVGTHSTHAIRNVTCSGRFSSDRTIEEYAAEIWKVMPCPVP